MTKGKVLQKHMKNSQGLVMWQSIQSSNFNSFGVGLLEWNLGHQAKSKIITFTEKNINQQEMITLNKSIATFS